MQTKKPPVTQMPVNSQRTKPKHGRVHGHTPHWSALPNSRCRQRNPVGTPARYPRTWSADSVVDTGKQVPRTRYTIQEEQNKVGGLTLPDSDGPLGSSHQHAVGSLRTRQTARRNNASPDGPHKSRPLPFNKARTMRLERRQSL